MSTQLQSFHGDRAKSLLSLVLKSMRKEVMGALAEGRGAIPLIKKVRCNDVVVHLYSIGWLAYWTKLAPVTLRLWQRKKILPEPVFQTPGSYRWYSSREVLEYAKLVETHYSVNRDMRVLRASLRAVHSKLVGQYSTLDSKSKARYDASYIALPSQDAHEQAMLATKSLERSSAKADFHLKITRKKKIQYETEQAQTGAIRTDDKPNEVRIICPGKAPSNVED